MNGGATPPLDTTGADLLVAIASRDVAGPLPIIGDSHSHTWIQVLALEGVLTGHVVWYAKNARGHVSHTFTVSGLGIASGLIVHAFRGDRSDPLRLTAGITHPGHGAGGPRRHAGLQWIARAELFSGGNGRAPADLDGPTLTARPRAPGLNVAVAMGI